MDFDKQIVDHVTKRMDDIEDVMQRVADKTVEYTRDATLEGEGLSGNRFTDYAPSTAKKKKRSSPVTFRHTGVAMQNLYGDATDDVAEVIFPDEYMGYHQGSNKSPNVPEREIFPKKKETGKYIDKITSYMSKQVEKHLNG